MSVKTCRMLPDDRSYGKHKCAICARPAHYWSQDGLKNGVARGEVVFHCQAHYHEARRMAAGLNARINLRGNQAKIRGQRGGGILSRLFRG